LQNLINKTLSAIGENTIAVEAKYYPRTGVLETLKVIPEYGEYEKDDSGDIVSSVVFHLSTRKPKYGDAVVYNNVRYTVIGHKQVGDRYDIITETVQHKTGRNR